MSDKQGLTARIIALRTLYDVLNDNALPDDAFAAHMEGEQLSPSDRAFAWTLVMTVLRRGREAQAAVKLLLQTPKSLPPSIHHLLWLGYIQLFALGTPPHAAISTSTELSKRIDDGRFSGLVNAVLRKAAEPDVDLALVNLAPWLNEGWRRAYGEETTQALAEEMMELPALDLTIKGDPAAYAARVEGEVLPGGSVRLPTNTDVTKLPGFEAGEFWVQDAAAALPITLLGDLSGQTALDVGAAPGGKTAQLIKAGAEVTALDISSYRARRLQQNLDRLQYDAEIVVEDALEYRPATPFDLVVLDAPCSATGTLRRHPELGWQKTRNDIRQQAELQAKMLGRAKHWVKKGGTLLFITCSLEPEEGEAQLSAFIAKNANFKVEPFENPPFGTVGADGSLRILPTDIGDKYGIFGGNDGFFVARLRHI